MYAYDSLISSAGHSDGHVRYAGRARRRNHFDTCISSCVRLVGAECGGDKLMRGVFQRAVGDARLRSPEEGVLRCGDSVRAVYGAECAHRQLCGALFHGRYVPHGVRLFYDRDGDLPRISQNKARACSRFRSQDVHV